MSGYGSSGVGDSTSLTVVYPASVSGSSSSTVPPSSTHFLSSSLSSSTSNSATVNAFNELLTMSQHPQTATLSTSNVAQIDSSPIPSSVTSTDTATTTFTTATKGLGASFAVVPPGASSPVEYAKAAWGTLPPPTTSSSTIPAAYDPVPLEGTSSAVTTQGGYMGLAHNPAALGAGSTRAASFANHRDHGTGTLTSDSAPEHTSRRVQTSNLARISSIVSGTTATTESASTSAHTAAKRPKPPHQIVSASVPVNTPTTQSEFYPLTRIISGSPVPIPTTTSSDIFPDSSSTSNSLLPFILGPVLGVLVIVALGMTIFRCRARRRCENMSNVLSSSSRSSQERGDWMMTEETPRANAVTLGRRITSYRGSSIYTSEHIITRFSHAGEFLQNSIGEFSNPFADSSEIVSSRTSMPPASVRSVDSVSTNLAFTVSVSADARDVVEVGSSNDASTSSLELHFAAPLATDDSLTRSPYSPSWHYDGQSPPSSPRGGGHWNEEEQGEASPVSLQASPPASPKPFPLGTESARLHLHALLKEARKISCEQELNKPGSARASVQSRDNK